MGSNGYSLILFDGVCNLCNSTVNFIIKHDNNSHFKFSAIQTDKGRSITDKLKINLVGIDSVILVEGNRYYIKSTAILRITKLLGGLWKLFYLLIVIPRPIRDFFYDILAKHRYNWFGMRDKCMIPDERIRERFLNEG